MNSRINIQDLPANLIAYLYQFLETKEMVLASGSSKRMRKAFNQDFIFIELAKRDHLFLPSEGEKFNTWKEYFLYLKQLKTNLSSGKPNVGFKMIPYRGHKFPIEAFAIFSHKKENENVIVSGDSDGNVLTWNLDEDGDKEKDLIVKADAGIMGIKNLNDDSNMLVWTRNNTFFYYEVNMFKKTEKNSERFEFVKKFSLEENDNPIKQIYYEESNSRIYMSPDLSDTLKLSNIYSINLKNFLIDKFKFDYNTTQTNLVLNDGNPNNNNLNNQGWNAFNNNNNNHNVLNPYILPNPIHIFPNPNPLFPNPYHPQIHPLPIYEPIKADLKESRKKNIKYFVVNEDKVFLYINKEPIRNRMISSYNNKNSLPNVFYFKKNTFLANGCHIDLDYIYNILLINNDEVAFIGRKNTINNDTQIIMKIYNTSYFSQSKEIVLYKEASYNRTNLKFDLIYFKFPEMYYLINEKELKKIENVGVQQLKVVDIGTLKEILSINCIEADEFRIVLASDELYMSIFDLKTGKMWFNLLGGSKTVVPKSFVKHPNYEGFNQIQITRNSIVSVIGNLIREYRFTFKFVKK